MRVILDREANGEILIAVRDDGIGFKAARETALPGKDEGLGLDLVDALVQQISGRLERSDDGGSVSLLRFMPPAQE